MAESSSSYSSAFRFHDECSDIQVGMCANHVWGALGWHDIRQRYRRSVLGPFWFTLSTLIMVVVLGFLYSTLLGQEIEHYLPYLGIGLVVWQYISACINEGSNAFIESGHLIKQIRLPLTIHATRVIWRNFIILMHSLPVVFVLLLLFGYAPGLEVLLVIPGLVLLFLNGVWISIVFGILCTRYRDVLPIVANLVMVGFFFTPVMWMPELLQDRGWVADFNPLYHMIEIVRAPMIGRDVQLTSWVVGVSFTLVGFWLAQMLMKRARNRVAYWL